MKNERQIYGERNIPRLVTFLGMFPILCRPRSTTVREHHQPDLRLRPRCRMFGNIHERAQQKLGLLIDRRLRWWRFQIDSCDGKKLSSKRIRSIGVTRVAQKVSVLRSRSSTTRSRDTESPLSTQNPLNKSTRVRSSGKRIYFF